MKELCQYYIYTLDNKYFSKKTRVLDVPRKLSSKIGRLLCWKYDTWSGVFFSQTRARRLLSFFVRNCSFFYSPDGDLHAQNGLSLNTVGYLSPSQCLLVAQWRSFVVHGHWWANSWQRRRAHNESSAFAINRPTFHKFGKTVRSSVGEEDVKKLTLICDKTVKQNGYYHDVIDDYWITFLK